MAEDSLKIKVVSPNIKKILETMEYGKISDNTNLSTQWLKEKQKGIVYAYIDKKEEGCKGKSTQIKDIHNKHLLATVYSPNSQDVEKIILKSSENTAWAHTEAIERAILIERLAREIERNSSLFCQLEVVVRGILSTDTKSKALPLLSQYLHYYASWAVKHEKDDPLWKPQGVTASIISEDSFLGFFGFILGPSLAAGYNIILQTEPKISVIAALIIELAENVGIPEGVIKLLPGAIDTEYLFKHKDIAVITSFGNFYTNKYNIHRPLDKKFLAISNSSKIPMIVFNSGDLDSACDAVIDAAWAYQGSLPWSVNTVIVQEDIFQVFVDKLKYRLSKVKMNFATDKLADLSYPVIPDAKKRLDDLVHEAKLQGIDVFQNSLQLDAYQPTLLIGERPFGNNVILEDQNLPLLTIRAFRTSNEAVSLANNTRFGFGASVWTENIGLANEVANKLHVSNVWINSHGLFSAAAAIVPQKESGMGYFGGKEGFYEYINTKHSSISEKVSQPTRTNLPQKFENSPLQSFYAGTFKKSESGLVDGVFDYPVGKDLYNAILAAKKGQEVWGKMTLLERSELLRKFANAIACDGNLEGEIKNVKIWIRATYEAIAQLNDFGNTLAYKSYVLQGSRKPVGVVAIQETLQKEKNFNAIVGALLLGNSVIILDCDTSLSQFYINLSKICSASNIPSGVFNVIVNCNSAALTMVIGHKELSTYFMCRSTDLLNTTVKDLKRFYFKTENWSQILITATKIKNIWANVGESVL